MNTTIRLWSSTIYLPPSQLWFSLPDKKTGARIGLWAMVNLHPVPRRWRIISRNPAEWVPFIPFRCVFIRGSLPQKTFEIMREGRLILIFVLLRTPNVYGRSTVAGNVWTRCACAIFSGSACGHDGDDSFCMPLQCTKAS